VNGQPSDALATRQKLDLAATGQAVAPTWKLHDMQRYRASDSSMKLSSKRLS
jgi:hypothetical protein